MHNIYKLKELESYFIEVINEKGKNTIIGTIYIHPCMDQNIFIGDYFQSFNNNNNNNKINLFWEIN